MNTDKPVVCIYHTNCMDGLLAAYVVGLTEGVERVEFIATQYGRDHIGEFTNRFDDRTVYIVDFSFDPTTYIQLFERSKHVVMFDHHASAVAKWAGLQPPENHIVVFDLEKSGIGITWEVLCKAELPLLLQYAQDYDLWKFELPDSRMINAGLQLRNWMGKPMEDVYAEIDSMVQIAQSPVAGVLLDQLAADGRLVDTYRAGIMEPWIAGVVVTRWVYHSIGGLNVGIVNGPINLSSQLGEAVLARYPNVDVACTYSDLHKVGKRVYSFRSRVGTLHAKIVAESLGGGGHGAAAAASRPLNEDIRRFHITEEQTCLTDQKQCC